VTLISSETDLATEEVAAEARRAGDLTFSPEVPLAQHGEGLRAAARRRLPRAIFDFIEGGSYDEVTLGANCADLRRLRLRQRVMVDASSRTQRAVMLGQTVAMPVALGPTGFSGLLYPLGEIRAARVAKSMGVPYCLSTFSICSIEDVAAATGAPFMFQLYLFRDRGVNASLLERAQAARCSTLVLTMDAHIQGRRNRDLDNGLTVPLRVRPRLAMQMTFKPLWLFNWLFSARRTLGTLAPYSPKGSDLASVSDWVGRNYKGAFDLADLEWVRKSWPGRLVIKGILDPDDARRAVDLGADAILVSNHGGRQLDSAQSTARAFPAVREAVGDQIELYFDGGIRTGLDVLKALGLGAKGCFIGRSYLYGLSAYGERGVRAALQLLSDELDVGMALTGVKDLTALPPDLIYQPDPDAG
jgi:L-lactate dehydrogenase (cytochrome)